MVFFAQSGQDFYLDNCHPLLARWWHPVMRSENIRPSVLVSVQLLDKHYALLRTATGEISAFLDECPHRRMPLSIGSVVGETVRCAYHGWQFAADGRCVAVPALGDSPPRQNVRAQTFRTRESGGLVWLAPEQPAPPPIDLTQADTFVEISLPPIKAAIGAGLMIENFLDVAHFPIVHASTFGTSGLSAQRIGLIADYQIKYEPDGLEAALDIDCPDHRTIENAVLCKRRFTYSYRVPFTATVSLEHTLTGARSTSVLAVQPESESICQIFYHVSFNRAASCGADHDKIQKFEQQIMAEDLVVQEAYRDKRLLLRGGSEESIVADRITLAFRKSLLRSLIRLAAADAQ